MDIPKTTEPPDPLPEGIPVSIIDANPYSIQVVDLKGYTIRYNQAFLDLFGMAPPPGYSIFEDPLLRQAGLIPKLQECLQGRRSFLAPRWIVWVTRACWDVGFDGNARPDGHSAFDSFRNKLPEKQSARKC